MGDVTRIGWTDHTFNPWWGCSRVSPACRSCYADTLARRWGMDDLWHRHGPRRMLSDATWARPLRWNRDAAAAGTPARVFCASMADVFEDHPDVTGARARLWDLIEATPWLRWQLLTKRPENVAGMVPWAATWPASVWLGTSVENPRLADQRIPVLTSLPARTRFLSCEPLLAAVDLAPWLGRLDWVITGGESGPRRREMDPAWLTSVTGQCQAAGVPCFVKQDSGPQPGQQGRIPDAIWALKQFPVEFPDAQLQASGGAV
jgi:protein gp37